MNQDLISRQAAIEALQNHYEVRNPKQNAIMDECVMLISNVPSVQTEKMQLSKENATKGTTFDCIDRKVAIDALDALCDRECEYSKQQRSVMCGACRLGSAFDVIDELPSAQPEHLVKESGNLVNGLVNDCISRQAAIDANTRAVER